MGESDDTYTDDDRPPQSNVPIDVQITVTVWFSALVVAVILIGCCISRRGCWFHSELNSMLRGLNTFSSPCTKITMKRPRAGGLGSTNPLLSGRLSLLCSRFISHRITCDSTLPPMRRDEEIVLQTYVLTWKLLTEKSRSQTLLATYFGLPLLGLFTCWLLYAIFSTKHSSGELEQYVTGLSLVFVTQSVSANVVAEKSLKLRESLRQMGVRDVAYWFSLVIIVETLVMGTCLALLEATGAVSFRLFHSVGRGYSQTWTSQDSADAWTEIFGLMWAYCAASVGLAVFVSVFCASPSTASLATFGTHIFATILFLVLKMSAASAIESARSVFMLCPPLALTLAFVGLSSTFARYPMTTRVPLKVVTNWLLLDSVLYVLLATYLARVLPSEYGTKEPWWFPFARLLDWWRGRNEQQRPPSTILNIMAQNLVSDDTESEEERSQGLGGTPGEKPTVIIRKLRKSFGGHVALNDVSLDLFEGEVLALLGHNGAGKSTLINMLTRLLPTDEPSQSATLATHVEGGRWHIELMEPQDMDWRGVSIYGHELNDSAVHRLLGVCPQHDVLFEHITAREHTALCACVKGGEIESTNANGDSLLRTFGLQDRYDHLGSELSGGMRRKLSAACALVGGSRFVILDEPSTGMDPLARRELWDLLSSVKPGRTLLLSTHYMDEAMALGDKVAILRYGEVVCHAPPEDVARDLGAAGYKLVCDLREGIVENRVKTNALTTFVLENVPGAGAWCDGARSEAACKVFGLPADRPIEIGNLVAALEEDAKDGGTRFGVLAVGVGAADLEDAFMRVGGADPPPCDAEAQYVSDYDGDIEEQKSQERLETATFLARAGALCAKRLRTAARDWKTLPLLLVPIGSAVAAFALNAKDKLGNRGSSSANIATIIIVMLAFAPTAGLLAEHVVAERASKLRDVLTVAGCDARCYVCGTFAGDLLLFVFVSACVAICAVSTGTVVNNHTQTIEFRWPRDASDIPTSYIYELLYNFVHYTIDIDEINIDDIDDIDDLQKKAMPSFEDDGWIENAIPVLNKLTDDQVREFEDWAVTQGYLNETDDAWRNFDIQDDDENIARWAATAPQLWFFMPLFVIHLITFSYAASHLFKTAREAVVLLPMLIICLLFAPIIVISLFNLTFGKSGIGLVDISKSTLLGVMFWGIAICSPHGALLVALASLTSNIATNFANQYPSFAATCTIAIVEASVYAAVAYALDARAAQARIPRVIFDAPPPDDEDEDVREERQRVFDLYDAAMCSSPLLIRGLRKVYTTPRRASRQATVVVAVDSLSLEISDGEIFGLLGAKRRIHEFRYPLMHFFLFSQAPMAVARHRPSPASCALHILPPATPSCAVILCLMISRMPPNTLVSYRSWTPSLRD